MRRVRGQCHGPDLTRIAITPILVPAILALSVLAEAQPATKTWRIGYLTVVGSPRQTIVLETRSAEGNIARFPELAVDLVRSKVVNLRTAKALGLMIPAAVLLRADQLIE